MTNDQLLIPTKNGHPVQDSRFQINFSEIKLFPGRALHLLP